MSHYIKEDHQFHHYCWTGRVSKREEDYIKVGVVKNKHTYLIQSERLKVDFHSK